MCFSCLLFKGIWSLHTGNHRCRYIWGRYRMCRLTMWKTHRRTWNIQAWVCKLYSTRESRRQLFFFFVLNIFPSISEMNRRLKYFWEDCFSAQGYNRAFRFIYLCNCNKESWHFRQRFSSVKNVLCVHVCVERYSISGIVSNPDSHMQSGTGA